MYINLTFSYHKTSDFTLMCDFFAPSPSHQLVCRSRKYDTLSAILGRVAQSVKCLARDACLTADPGVVSLIRARSHTFVEIDHEIISMVILLPTTESFKKGCCQLQG